ncbi:MAG TPA: hypothetical protein VIR29_01460 [Anseongella sp.]
MELSDITSTSLEEVFSTSAGTVYQSDAERCLYIDFAGKRTSLNILCLIRLKTAVEKVDIDNMLLDATSPDLEIISICACEHCFVLNATGVLALRELLQGTFVMFKLNHLIRDCLYRLPVL